jgi:uncharacterized protein
MKTPLRAVAAAATLGTSIASAAFGQQPASAADHFVGNWQGALVTPTARLRLGLSVARGPSGALSGELTSIDQGNAKIPASISMHGDTLVVTSGTGATYSAVFSAADDSLHGSFVQGQAFPLDMGRLAAPAPPSRPQEPKPPFPYDTQDVSFESAPGVRLAGTLTIPPGAGPFPGVALITGSGPQNRDEELVGHKPFLVIADYLARHGIATLRCDDRGIAKSTGNFATATSVDFANDAEAAVHFLRTQPRIAHDHVGLMGHSEGGLIAPMVAARSSDVAFIVLLAGPGIAGDSILLLQQALIAKAAGAPAAAIEQGAELNRRFYAVIKTTSDSAAAAAQIAAISAKMVAALPEAQHALATEQLKQAQAQLMSPWMRYFLTYDPAPALRKVKVPVLALNGTLDLQVPYKENLPAISAALTAAGNHDFKVVEMPGLNHLFQPATTGSPTEYATIPETFSPAALDIIATWIHAHADGKK